MKQIRLLITILSGENKKLTSYFQKKMDTQSNALLFEDAILTRNSIHTLNTLLFSRSFGSYDTFEYDKQETITNEFMQYMRTVFHKNITKKSFRIECYDASTLFDAHSTGSMVVFENGTFSYAQYKRFKIKESNTSDFDRIKDIMHRRFRHKEWTLPDLILVDGGRLQVSIVSNVLRDFMLPIPVIGIAKRPDRIVYQNSVQYSKLKRSNVLFKLFQQLRDESHRFAKKYHLLLRHKEIMV